MQFNSHDNQVKNQTWILSGKEIENLLSTIGSLRDDNVYELNEKSLGTYHIFIVYEFVAHQIHTNHIYRKTT